MVNYVDVPIQNVEILYCVHIQYAIYLITIIEEVKIILNLIFSFTYYKNIKRKVVFKCIVFNNITCYISKPFRNLSLFVHYNCEQINFTRY
jgi:hypothetical protein